MLVSFFEIVPVLESVALPFAKLFLLVGSVGYHKIMCIVSYEV